jgi:hypothetical protein
MKHRAILPLPGPALQQPPFTLGIKGGSLTGPSNVTKAGGYPAVMGQMLDRRLHRARVLMHT